MLTALFIQHDQGSHAHLVTLQHNNDVTIARQTARWAVGAVRGRFWPAARRTQQLTRQTQTTKERKENRKTKGKSKRKENEHGREAVALLPRWRDYVQINLADERLDKKAIPRWTVNVAKY